MNTRAKSGGGSLMNKNVSVPVRTGQPAKGTSPGAADQFGQAMGAKRAVQMPEQGRAYNSGVKLGNEACNDVGPGGPGTGRTVHPAGGQGRH
jgi:hypothetical protein